MWTDPFPTFLPAYKLKRRIGPIFSLRDSLHVLPSGRVHGGITVSFWTAPDRLQSQERLAATVS